MDFNEDFAKIDSAIAARGNCLQVVGTYTGDGNYGKGKRRFCTSPSGRWRSWWWAGVTKRPRSSCGRGTKGAANDTAGMGSVLSLAWGEDSLSWYVTGWASGGSTSAGTSAEGQLNEKGAHYTYLVLG